VNSVYGYIDQQIFILKVGSEFIGTKHICTKSNIFNCYFDRISYLLFERGSKSNYMTTFQIFLNIEYFKTLNFF